MIAQRTIAAPVFLLCQALLIRWMAGSERPPAAPDLSRFSTEFGAWTQIRQDPIAAEVQSELRADRLLSADYSNRQTNSIINLFIAWFGSQRAGASQPHSPKVCLPGAGWTPESAGDIRLRTALGPATVNRYLVTKGQQRAIVLYWYQTPRRVVAGEWTAKFWLVRDALEYRRTDTALVRLVAWSAPGKDADTTAMVSSFAESVYPLLVERLPR